MLGHALWQQQFGGDPATVGRTIRLEGMPHLVLGVMPAGFDYPDARELWVPQLYDRGWSSATAFGRILAATAFLASLVPAWRAAMVDPLVALRRE